MRRLIIAAVILWALARPVLAAQQLPRELLRAAPEAAGALREMDGGLSLPEALSGLMEDGVSAAGRHLTAGLRRASMLAAGVLLLSFVDVMAGRGDEGVRGAVTLAGTLWITAVTAGEVEAMMGLGRAAVEQLALVSKLLVPAMATAAAASGSVTAAGAFQAAAVLFSDILLSMIQKLLLPGVYIYTGLCAASAVLEGTVLEKLALFLKRGITWSLCTLMGGYTAFLTLSGAAAGAADRRMVQAAKTVFSAAVPVVGRVLSEAAETLLAGAGLLQATLGTFGALAVVSICAAPVLRLGGQYLLYQGAALAASFGGAKELGKLLERLSGAFALVLAMAAAAAVLLVISIISVLKVAVI